MRKINAAGLEIIKSSESLRLVAYLAPEGRLTIGFGHTGPGVREGMRITREDADAFLEGDLENAQTVVQNAVRMPLDDNQFSALVSFVYNVGAGQFFESTMIRLLNEGSYRLAAGEFPKWNHVKGVVEPGLTARRAAERRLFLTPNDGEATPQSSPQQPPPETV